LQPRQHRGHGRLQHRFTPIGAPTETGKGAPQPAHRGGEHTRPDSRRERDRASRIGNQPHHDGDDGRHADADHSTHDDRPTGGVPSKMSDIPLMITRGVEPAVVPIRAERGDDVDLLNRPACGATTLRSVVDPNHATGLPVSS